MYSATGAHVKFPISSSVCRRCRRLSTLVTFVTDFRWWWEGSYKMLNFLLDFLVIKKPWFSAFSRVKSLSPGRVGGFCFSFISLDTRAIQVSLRVGALVFLMVIVIFRISIHRSFTRNGDNVSSSTFSWPIDVSLFALWCRDDALHTVKQLKPL